LVVGKRNFSVGYFWEDIYRVKRSVQNHPVSVPNCPTEIPHGMTWVGSRTLMVRCLRLTTWSMAWHSMLWGCLWQEGWSNLQLQTQSNQRDR